MRMFARLAMLGTLAFVVIIGTYAPTPISAQDECVNTYVIQEGDTLYGIALENSVDLGELAAANDIEDPTLIFAGATLCLDGLSEALPSDGEESAEDTEDTEEPIVETPPPTPEIRVQANADLMIRDVSYTTDDNGIYVVRTNDRLYNLSVIFGVDQAVLAEVNGIADTQVIFVGQELIIPEPSFSTEVPGTIPALALVPRVARPNEDTVTIHGANFPPATEINIYAEKFSLNRASEVLATVNSDETGRFTIEVTVPETFADGGALDMRTVSFTARVAENENVFGTNFFLNLDWLDANNR